MPQKRSYSTTRTAMSFGVLFSRRKFYTGKIYELNRYIAVAFDKAFTKYAEANGVKLGELAASGVAVAKTGADFQSNMAFGLAKVLSKTRKINPREVAESVLKNIPLNHEAISRVDISGAGFINIHLRDDWLGDKAIDIARLCMRGGIEHSSTEHSNCQCVPSPAFLPPRNIVLDYCSPNYGKDLHAGHIRSSCIGDTLLRLLLFSGHAIRGISHVGDAGAALAASLQQLVEATPDTADDYHPAIHASWDDLEKLSHQSETLPSAKHLASVYERAKRRLSVDPAFKVRVGKTVQRLQRFLSRAPAPPTSPHHSYGGIRSRTSVVDLRSRFCHPPSIRSDNTIEVDELTAEDRVARAWWVVCEASRRRFGYLHARIGVVSSSSLLDPKNVYPAPVSGTSVTGGWGWGRQILEMGESSYVPLLQGTIDELNRVELIACSQGALVVPAKFALENAANSASSPVPPSVTPPCIVQKSDGTFPYVATDLAAIKYRVDSGGDWLIYVTDIGQALHFKQLFTVAEQAGWLRRGDRKEEVQVTTKSEIEVCDNFYDVWTSHVGFGLVGGSDGKKLSSSAGVKLSLQMLLDAAVEKVRAVQILKGQSSHQCISGASLGLENLEKCAEDLILTNEEELAVSSVRYHELSHAVSADYVFSFDSMLQLKGNTSIYLFYACARLGAVLRKFNLRNFSQSSEIYSDSSAIARKILLDTPVTDAFLLAQKQNRDQNNVGVISVQRERFNFSTAAERNLAFSLARLPDSISVVTGGFVGSPIEAYPHYRVVNGNASRTRLSTAGASLSPHIVVSALHDIAASFHTFYDECKILGHESEKERILLCAATYVILLRGIDLLGLREPPEQL